MRAFDLWHIEQARGIADQHRTGHFDFRQRLIAALHDRARTRGDYGSAFKQRFDLRVVLELLESLERRQQRIAVVETGDESYGDAILIEVIQERPTVSRIVERPTDGVHHLAWRDAA